MMTPDLVVAVETPPDAAARIVTLADVKAHLRIEHASEDGLLGVYLDAAHAHVEAQTSFAMRVTQYAASLTGFPASGRIDLPWPPLKTVDGVAYVDVDGVTQELDASLYSVVKRGSAAAVVLKPSAAWPETAEGPEAVVVTWTSGLDPDDKRLDAARHAVRLVAAHFYANREATSDKPPGLVPHAVDALLTPYRQTGWI